VVPVAVYLLCRLWQLVSLGTPVQMSDTPMYREPGQRALDFGQVSFTGLRLRPWPITIPYGLVGSDGGRIILQSLFATACWGYLIVECGRLSRRKWITLATAGIVAVFALTAGVSGWDAVLMSESFTLSLLALFLASTLTSLRRGPTTLNVIVPVLTAAAAALVRPVLLPLLVVPPGLLALRFWKRWHRRDRTFLLIETGAVALVALGAAGYVFTYNAHMDDTWGNWIGSPGLNGRVVLQFYIASNTPGGPGLIEEMIADGAPVCLRYDPTINPDWLTFLRTKQRTCMDGLRWESDHFVTWLVKDLAAHPSALRSYLHTALGDQALLRTEGSRSIPSPVPAPIVYAFFSAHRGRGDPMAFWLIAVLAVAVARLNVRARAPDAAVPPDRREQQYGLLFLYLFAAGVVALLGTALLSAVDASRVALPATVLIRLVFVCALAVEGTALIDATQAVREPVEVAAA
jgi:hypothetical protein